MLSLTAMHLGGGNGQDLGDEKGESMNKAELVASVAKSANTSKVNAEKAVNGVFANMVRAMKEGGKVSLLGFGTFTVVKRIEKKGRNPQTGRDIIIPAHKAVKFKPGRTLYRRVQKLKR